MKKIFVVTFLIIMFSITLFAKIDIVPKNNNQYIVDFTLENYSISNKGKFVNINSDNLFHSDETGIPDLPFDKTNFIIPENGSISFRILSQKTENISLKKQIIPIATLKKIINKNGRESWSEIPIIGANYHQIKNNPVELLKTDRFRDYYFQSIRINPFQYNPKKNELHIYKKIRMLIIIKGNLGKSPSKNNLDDLAQPLFINWNEGKNWTAVKREREIHYFDFSKSDFWYKFQISADGMYVITKDDLSELPISDVDPRTIRIFSTGGESCIDNYTFVGNKVYEIPLEIDGENDGIFDNNDRIIFYAQDRVGKEVNSHLQMYVNPYNTNTVYWLTFGGNFENPPKRIKVDDSILNPEISVSSVLQHIHNESENILEISGRLKWFSDNLSGNTTSIYKYYLNFDDFSSIQNNNGSSDYLTKLKILFRGASNTKKSTYKVQITVNDSTDIPHTWTSNTDKIITFSVPNSWKNGQNKVEIKVIRNYQNTLYLDYYDAYYFKDLIKRDNAYEIITPDSMQNKIVQYNFTGDSQNIKVFQISDFHDINLIPIQNGDLEFNFIAQNNYKGRYYIVNDDDDYKSIPKIQSYSPTNIADTSNQYDCIIVTPEEFISQANELKNINSQYEGLTSKIVTQQQIFDQFNGGNPSPLSIRLFLKYAYNNFPENKISYLILFGSGTHEWNHNNGINTDKNRIMVYNNGPDETDDGFAYLFSNNHPDLAVGRIPVQNTAQADNYINKLNDYLENQQTGFWHNEMVFFADDNIHSTSVLDTSHTMQMEEVSNYLSPSIVIDKLFGMDFPLDQYRNKPEARDAMIASVNKGKLIWYYIGHGAYYGLGDEDYFIANTDMHFLNNKDKLTLFIAASCSVGEFDYLSFDSCADQLVNYENGGSIVSIAATRECNGPANTSLLKSYLGYSTNNYTDVGTSLMLAKTASVSTNNSRRFLIFGNPALHITTPYKKESITIQDNPDSLQARQLAKISGDFSSPINGIGETFVIDSFMPQTYVFPVDTTFIYVDVTHPSKNIFKGKMSVENGNFISNFIVPDDIKGGNSARIISYAYDENTKENYISYFSPLTLNGHNYVADNPDAPEIQLWLENYDFEDGDKVSSSPTLLANISDNNGINILGNSGHKIYALIDNSIDVNDLSEYFIYDVDSYTSGKIIWQLPEISSGKHQLQLIAFDNFNTPSTKKINFEVDKNDAIIISKMYPYPNPMKNNCNFTFNLSSDADVTITIYTIRGRKIRKLVSYDNKRGYNQIFWDGLDQDGEKIANNTYFYKLSAKKIGTDKESHKIDKITVYK